MVPDLLRAANPTCFIPRVIRIGPSTNKDDNLFVCDDLKTTYVKDLLSRVTSSPMNLLETCLKKVHDKMDKVKASYSWVIAGSDADIANTLLKDAFFIIEYCCKFSDRVQCRLGNNTMIKAIARDLILHDNQIPFFILQDVFECTLATVQPATSLVEHLLPVVSSIGLFKTNLKINNVSTYNAPHILGLFHELFRPSFDVEMSPVISRIHSVTNLNKAGFKFEPNHNSEWVMAVTVSYRSRFTSTKPTMKLPRLCCVTDHTESVLLNLVVYEQTLSCHKYFTSYVQAMSKLMETKEDVTKLVEARIIYNYMCSDDEVADKFSNILKHVTCEDSYYEDEWTKLNKYYNSYGSAWLRRNCLCRPWDILCGIVTAVSVVSSLLQTIFTIKYATNTPSL